jgi:hypothetical protein
MSETRLPLVTGQQPSARASTRRAKPKHTASAVPQTKPPVRRRSGRRFVTGTLFPTCRKPKPVRMAPSFLRE